MKAIALSLLANAFLDRKQFNKLQWKISERLYFLCLTNNAACNQNFYQIVLSSWKEIGSNFLLELEGFAETKQPGMLCEKYNLCLLDHFRSLH